MEQHRVKKKEAINASSFYENNFIKLGAEGNHRLLQESWKYNKDGLKVTNMRICTAARAKFEAFTQQIM